MQRLQVWTAVSVIAGCLVASSSAMAADKGKAQTEEYFREPMPGGFQVISTELEGPVFADARGRTMYRWPANNLRNGDAGEPPGKPGCYNTKYRETAGFTSPYPAGNLLPNADNRPTCIEHWPPVLAGADAKPIGNFTILERTDGTRQWAYKNYALYTSHMDTAPGQTNGGTMRRSRDQVSNGAPREPVGPASAVPAQFGVATMALGRVLVTAAGDTVYAYDRDTATKSNCTGACLEEWRPVAAPESAIPRGEWTIIAREGGSRQWVFRGQPLYTLINDVSKSGGGGQTDTNKKASFVGSDVPGWDNVYTQHAPSAPKGFHFADTHGGQIIVDPNGRAIYYYSCVEDTPDTLYCNNPDSEPVYRWAVCGGGDPDRCLRTFPYVIADRNAKSDSIAWSIMEIEPKTGHVAKPGEDSVRVWAFRGRPIYHFHTDQDPSDIGGDSWGQDHGVRNGFTAFWVRSATGSID